MKQKLLHSSSTGAQAFRIECNDHWFRFQKKKTGKSMSRGTPPFCLTWYIVSALSEQDGHGTSKLSFWTPAKRWGEKEDYEEREVGKGKVVLICARKPPIEHHVCYGKHEDNLFQFWERHGPSWSRDDWSFRETRAWILLQHCSKEEGVLCDQIIPQCCLVQAVSVVIIETLLSSARSG